MPKSITLTLERCFSSARDGRVKERGGEGMEETGIRGKGQLALPVRPAPGQPRPHQANRNQASQTRAGRGRRRRRRETKTVGEGRAHEINDTINEQHVGTTRASCLLLLAPNPRIMRGAKRVTLPIGDGIPFRRPTSGRAKGPRKTLYFPFRGLPFYYYTPKKCSLAI